MVVFVFVVHRCGGIDGEKVFVGGVGSLFFDEKMGSAGGLSPVDGSGRIAAAVGAVLEELVTATSGVLAVRGSVGGGVRTTAGGQRLFG